MRPSERCSARRCPAPKRRTGFQISRFHDDGRPGDAGRRDVFYVSDAALAHWSRSDGRTSPAPALSVPAGDTSDVADYVDSAVDTMIDAGLLERELAIHASGTSNDECRMLKVCSG